MSLTYLLCSKDYIFFFFSDCDTATVPAIDDKAQNKELCPRCECKYENRNTTIINVIMLLIIINFFLNL